MTRTRSAKLNEAETSAPPPGVLASLRPYLSILVCLSLALVTLALYWPASSHDFVNYDDPDYVTSNSQVQKGITWQGTLWAFTSGHASNWHPLTWLSHMLDCHLFGLNSAGHHWTSIFFHIFNVLLLFLWLTYSTGHFWRAAIVAALFAWHPLRVESVAWISERKDVLSGFFFLLTLLAYTAYVKAGQVHPTHQRGFWFSRRPVLLYLLVLLLFSLGLMSKPMLVTTPFLLLLLDLWPLRRITLFSGPLDLTRLGYLVLEKLPLFVLCCLSSLITFLVQQRGGAVSASLSLTARLENAVVAYARYLRKWVWPNDLSVLYPHPGDWPNTITVACLMLLLGVTGLVIWTLRSRPYLGVGWFWFLGTLVPVIGIVQVGIQSMADRYTYIPMIGFTLASVWGLAELSRGRPALQRLLQLSALAGLAACLAVTAKQITFWRTSESLFTRAVQVTKNNYLAYNNLGFFLSGKGDVQGAMHFYLKSLQINPLYADALNNYGHALAQLGRHAEAVNYYEQALRNRPGQLEVHNNLGNALTEVGRTEEALQHYRFVLTKNPQHADAHNNLGIALAMQGKLEEAIVHFKQAIEHKPGFAGAHSNLGNAYAVQRKLSEAVKEYQTSLALNPKDAQAHNNLANALAELEQAESAVNHYAQALALNSSNPETHCNYAVLLIRLGRHAEARQHLLESLRLRPGYPAATRQLQSLGSAP